LSAGQKNARWTWLSPGQVLCLDEIAPHKRHGRYYLVISAPELGLVLDVLKDRKKASLEAWFDARGLEWCAAVEVCCADMWDAYHEAAQAKLPNTRQTVDRFHVMKNLNDAVTGVCDTITACLLLLSRVTSSLLYSDYHVLKAGDYRIFVGAFLTGELAECIQAVRLQHDAKTARITAPHVTMVGTYWHGPATPENERDAIARLQSVQRQLRPFELALGGVETFLPSNNVIYLRIERTAGLLAARKVLLDALGPDKERRYTPHLTLTTLAPAVQCRYAPGRNTDEVTPSRPAANRVAHRALGCPARSSLAHAARA
jgi:2'-5' RNA ligase